MDTTINTTAEPFENYFSQFPWLIAVAKPYLPAKCYKHSYYTYNGTEIPVTLHASSACDHATSGNRGQVYSETNVLLNGVVETREKHAKNIDTEQPAYMCFCMFEQALESFDKATFTRSLLALRRCQESLDMALKPDVYCLDWQFPAFRALTIRYHRYQIARAINMQVPLLSSAHEIYLNPCLESIRKQICEKWDSAEKNHPVDKDAVLENSMRYATRYFVWKKLCRGLADIPYKLHNPLNALVSRWLSGPLTTSLLEEYFDHRSEDFRKEACKVTTPSFSMSTIDSIDSDVRRHMDERTMIACHAGSPDRDPFDTSQGPRPQLMWYGVRARQNYTAWGEYPELVVQWLEDADSAKILGPYACKPGGPISRICESPSMDNDQWLLALKLWEDSFQLSGPSRDLCAKEDVSPYRDWKVAIAAAKAS